MLFLCCVVAVVGLFICCVAVVFCSFVSKIVCLEKKIVFKVNVFFPRQKMRSLFIDLKNFYNKKSMFD